MKSHFAALAGVLVLAAPAVALAQAGSKGTVKVGMLLPLTGNTDEPGMREELYGLDAAEADGTLSLVGSTYSRENEAVYDGLSRQGSRVVTFAPVLKQGLFPLPEILQALTGVAAQGMGGPVEIEFAVNLETPAGRPREFGFLQMRPLALAREAEAIDLGNIAPGSAVCS